MSSAAGPLRHVTVPSPAAAMARARVARRGFIEVVRRMRDAPLRVVLPDGRTVAGEARPGAPTMTILRDAFFHRLATAGRVGFGESYMARDWDADDLSGVLEAFARNLDRFGPTLLALLRRPVRWLRRPDHPNTVRGSAENISAHYDLSNDFFALFLDGTMTYSCAVFDAPDDGSAATTAALEAAQVRKYRAMCETAGVGASDRVLEIGTGWGGFAMHAARAHGCHVTTATISREQADLARRRVAGAGLSGLVDVVVQDYRRLRGTFDRIVSIEMFEAVGEEYWPAFFGACDRLLAPGGTMALQTITMPDRRFRATRRENSWTRRYIFPGGVIPSEPALSRAIELGSRLHIAARTDIGSHYARTLRSWRERFDARRDEVRALGFNDAFLRMWEFYLAMCEAGFRARVLGDVQLRLARSGEA